MNVLILGGTLFLGKHLAEQAVQRGMEMTLFNRGKTNPTFLQHTVGVTHLIGDRGTMIVSV
ncbi:hypothetical protein JCM19045_3213 [Bacillus sp. JCM 19045]|nr:hypothetical protein JCM19045_3213 [Bacillus sp. JCM 19045]